MAESGVGTDFHRDTVVIEFWAPRRMCVFDILIFDTDAASYYGRHPQKILSQHERCKKGKYLEACLERQHHFTRLVFYVYRVMGEDTKAATKKMSTSLSKKWDREYLATCGYVRVRLYLNLVRAFS